MRFIGRVATCLAPLLLTMSACQCQREGAEQEKLANAPIKIPTSRHGGGAWPRLAAPPQSPPSPNFNPPPMADVPPGDAMSENASTAEQSFDGQSALPDDGTGHPWLYIEADPLVGGAPLQVSFVARMGNVPPDMQLTWYFGDGTTAVGETKQEHLFTKAGLYEVELTIDWPDGQEKNTIVVQVTKRAFEVQIVADQPAGFAPLRVHFNAIAVAGEMVGGDDRDLRFEWQFGTGVRGFGQETDYTYTQPGSYTASLVVINKDGQRGRSTFPIEVLPPVDDASAEAAAAAGSDQ